MLFRLWPVHRGTKLQLASAMQKAACQGVVAPRAMRLSAPTRPLPCQQQRTLSRLVPHAQGNGAPKQLKFFYFDPYNPENVVEVVAKQQEQKSATPAAAASQLNGNGNGNGIHSHAAANGVAYSSNGNGSSTALQVVRDPRTELSHVQGLMTQLEAAKSTIIKLQQYELMYKESRMRTKQLSAELSTMQHLVADKDSELARQYKRMEAEAAERSSIRSQFNNAIDEVKSLRNELEEARQAILEIKGALPANLGSRRGSKAGLLSGSGGNGADGGDLDVAGAPEMLSSLQGLARQLADGMEHEVGTLFGAKREK